MTIYETIRNMLISNGIATTYSDAELDSFILEAKLLVDAPFVNDAVYEDYVDRFSSDKYMIRHYPLKESDDFNVLIDDKDITNNVRKITSNGIIYFDKKYTGSLTVSYVCGLNTTAINDYLIPIIVYLIKDKEGKNISSISEGDVSVSYNNSSNTSLTLDSLVNRLRKKYGARLRLL